MVAYAEPLPQFEVFVVDSAPESRDALVQRVHDAGFTVRPLPTAADALAQFPFRRPAIILSQLALSDMDGITLCSAIRKHAMGQRTRLLCVGSIAADLRPLLRDRYNAMFVDISQVHELLAPALRLLACESVAMPKESHTAFPVSYALVEDFVAECRHNVAAGALFVESDHMPSRGEVVTVQMRIPRLEYDVHLSGRVVTHDQFQHRDRLRRGFGVQLRDLPRNGSDAFCQMASTLEQLRNGERRVLPSGAEQWLLVVDPAQRLMQREFSFLSRHGLPTVTFAALETACEFATSNCVAWMGIAEHALATQPPSAADAMMTILVGSIGDVAIVSEKHGDARLTSSGVLHTSARDMANILAQRFDIAIRRAARVPYTASAVLDSFGQTFELAVVDLSRSGLLVRSNKPLPTEGTASIALTLPDHTHVNARGVVVRTTPEAAGTHLAGIALFDLKASGKLALEQLVARQLSTHQAH